MKGPTLKLPAAGRLRRTVLMLGVVGATAAGLLFTAAAQAVTGTQPGNLSLSPASGATTLTPTWSTTTACPAGYQTSAELYELNTDGSIGSVISPTLGNVVTVPFSGTLLGPVGKLLSLATNVKNGETSKWVVVCFAGRAGTGNRTYVQSDMVTLSADGRSYTSSTSSSKGSAQSVPWLLIGLGILLAVAGIGGWQAWRWRRHRLDDAQSARWATEQRLPRNSANRAKPASQPQGRE